jgi:hypothetical protein
LTEGYHRNDCREEKYESQEISLMGNSCLI